MPQYDPAKIEKRIYRLWEKSGYFAPKAHQPRADNPNNKKTYSISLPPPNITGALHMGHALNGTIQDILIRYHRMKGFKTLWMPGIDHAGIATQNKVEKMLREKGVGRKELGREKFEKEIWNWKKKYGNIIIDQLKQIGFSCDWSRLRFTMDKEYSQAVKTAFIHYYKKGVIYRGPRIVNWCPRCETAISDIEITYKQTQGKLYYIKYPINSNSTPPFLTERAGQNSNFITVATTRPETMLGDTAIAVNPQDERYKNLIGRTVTLPIMNREIPIIADRLIDAAFGTGAVKITPAHDILDNRIAKIHKLPVINVLGENGKMTRQAEKFAGLTTLEARETIIRELQNQNLLEKTEDYAHAVAICERCNSIIEPIISTQWFVKMKDLAKQAIKTIRQNKVIFIPKRFKKNYLNWMKNIEDWCISRQLWWGHKLPVWYCQTGRNSKFEIRNSKQILISPPTADPAKWRDKQTKNDASDDLIVAPKKPRQCPICKNCNMRQSDDVLDTWFSSALWPFATLDWPTACVQNQKLIPPFSKKERDKNQEHCQPIKNSDLDIYYPNDFLSTAQEILYLWVSRMIFSGMEFINKIPFHHVYIHPTVLNIKGQRMSKSLGTGVDPLGFIEKYGADALRFGIISQTSRDQQAIKFSEEYVNAGRKFANKLWNIGNFIIIGGPTSFNILQQDRTVSQVKTLPDNWILSRFNSVTCLIEKNIQNYQFDKALNAIYKFVWHELADWYVEINKIPKFQNVKLLQNIFQKTLIILHPFMPFITESLWKNIHASNNMLIIQSWPKVNKKHSNKKIEKNFTAIQKSVLKIRKARIDKKIPPQETIRIKLPKNNKTLRKYKDIIAKLGKAEISY